ncbi:MAG TPA: hypothetical protein DCE41_12430 [Cytophagales bacterium]|nr:hypothetical protein [Cytophagales bacterium]HAA20329.1 hypothetical protein [Cytophagales bacterium]HAP62902.1 hypothetical protein [Cytophagales bacterium]
MDQLLDFAKILLPAGLVLYAMYLVVRAFVQKELRQSALEIQLKSKETVLPLRLQAYERLTLLIERLNPNNLLVRLFDGSLSARQFQQVLLREIRDEFNHNLSQQIYVSEEAWNLVKNVREDLVMLINGAVTALPDDAPALELSKAVLQAYGNRDNELGSYALSQLKSEIQETF